LHHLVGDREKVQNGLFTFTHRAQYGSENQAKEYYAQCICTVPANVLKTFFIFFKTSYQTADFGVMAKDLYICKL